MEVILSDCFGNNNRDVRITIFRDHQRAYCFSIYVYALIRFYLAWVTRRRPTLPKRGRYIYAKERNGTEFPSSRRSFFYNPETEKECEGIASVVWQSKMKSVVEDLPDIRDVNLDKLNLRSRSKEAGKVREYMKASHIRDLATLKQLNRRATHLYADVIWDEARKPKGVLVIDSVQHISPFTNEVIMRLEHYIRLFTPAI